MFAARLKLPAAFSEEEVQGFSQRFPEGRNPVSILRENNHHKGPWIAEWFFEEEPAEQLLGELLQHIPAHDNKFSVERIPDAVDWLAHSHRAFPPFSVGPFFIHGSHYAEKIPDEQMALQIDAATAFGSGEHGTTKGCIIAMLELKSMGVCPWNVLDMGTGSGILGIAAWKLWKTPVLAVDNDAEAVRVAIRHRDLNKVPGDATGMLCKEADGFGPDVVQQKKPYDLVIANILAGPLKDMAQSLMAVNDENGFVILSGLLKEQADEVRAAYADFKLKNRYDIGDWSTLVLQNTAA